MFYQQVEKWLALKKCAAFKTGSDRGSFISDESHNVNEKCREELDLLQEHLTDSKLNLPMGKFQNFGFHEGPDL